MARTSSRRAAQKAKEAISTTSETGGKASVGAKRKAPEQKAPAPKKEKKEEKSHQEKEVTIENKPEPKVEKPPEPELETKEKQPEQSEEKVEPDAEVDNVSAKSPKEGEEAPAAPTSTPQPGAQLERNVESGIRNSEEREDKVSSNVLEKGIIYFFFRPRVNVEDPEGVEDVARSFFVLRPMPLGAELGSGQGPVDKDARCRLLMLPKKKFPTSGKERDMGFVEKTNQSMKDLQENFIAGSTYQTSTRGERHVEEARPYAEGVYALTSTRRASHLAYVLTIPHEIGEIQENFGLHQRGSFIVQSKNPKYPGPSFARLPKEPEYPESVMEKFGDLRWVPLQPEFIEYPNAQFLMIGEAQDSLGKAATAEGGKKPHEIEPGEELERMEHENEDRIQALGGDSTIFLDLGLDAKKYTGVPTTWGAEETTA
ncbi:BTB domain transcription factor [Penicillium brasilianum]|uniref:BTB domain transcription factor n=1 Tax=Penicillium brasilianum TaxID=104259 RepID=A0A1S9RHV3_PENBI|nr:BTB domain transcription factor [Penicillium brasilianum]